MSEFISKPCNGLLKNKSDGERVANISEGLAELICAYLESPEREDVADKFDREPLLTTENGRIAIPTIRRDLYKLTRPCAYSNSCPHGRDIESCIAERDNHASECPSSHSPHPLRRFSIEKQIDRGVPKDQLSDRVDVSVPVLNEHYDQRKEERKRKQRLAIYEKLFEGYGEDTETLSESELDAITNDDGMIDPVKLSQLTRDAEEILDGTQENDSSSDTENRGGDDQLSLGDFTESQFVTSQPALIPVIGGLAFGRWLPDRLRREMTEMTPDSKNSIRLSPNRAAKGAAAYACYVIMIAANLSLMGILPA